MSTVLAVCKPARAVPLRLSRVPGWLRLTLIPAPSDGAPAMDMSNVTVRCTGGTDESMIGLPLASVSGTLRLRVLLWPGLIVPLLISKPLASSNW
ncbi:hypothetical protein D3C84_1032530 [compost metagenome]